MKKVLLALAVLGVRWSPADAATSLESQWRSEVERVWREAGLPARNQACPWPSRKSWSMTPGVRPPDVILRSRAGQPLSLAAPMLVSAEGEAFWVGVSARNPRQAETEHDPACFLAGSAAFYVIGTEQDPRFDFVETVRSGREGAIFSRLVELRWFDAAAGVRRRWLNRALARTLGWDVDGRGRPSSQWPLPAPEEPVNSLIP